MIGVDTNVLVRYIVQDDPVQSKVATRFIEKNCSVSNAGYINQIVLCEVVWVLKNAYEYNKELIVNVLRQILSTKEFIVENSQNVWLALKSYKDGEADFADYLMGHSNKSSGCYYTITFDKAAAKQKHFKLLK